MSALDKLQDILDSRISPMVYTMMFVNVLIGLFFLTGFDMGSSESVLYVSGVLIDPALWGGILIVTSSLGLFGFVRQNRPATMFSGIAGFMLWLFATISLCMQGHLFLIATTAIFHMVFHMYVYLATSIGTINRRAISKN